MKQINTDIVVVGGGPAGLAAALRAYKQGVKDVLIIERDIALGGILQQCIHDGFGLQRFKERLSGTQYAQRFIDEVIELGIPTKLDTMVLEIVGNKKVYACNNVDGMMEINCKSIILTMGCRERTASQVLIYGTRPAGVITAGSAQRYINMEGYLPGKKAVILGSGDIGLIMARRMTLEGIEVKGVYEVMQNPGGLKRNIVQCLEDYDIPLHLATTVTRVHGKKRVEGVTVAKVDENRKVIPGTEEYIECDLLVLAVGLIPENELSVQAGIEMDPKTKAPYVDNNFMTSLPGVFAAGNVSVVFDLVDYVSQSGEIAADGAVKFIKGELNPNPTYKQVKCGDNINFVVPQRIASDCNKASFFMRVKEPAKKVDLVCTSDDKVLKKQRHMTVAPPEMLSITVDKLTDSEITFKIMEV